MYLFLQHMRNDLTCSVHQQKSIFKAGEKGLFGLLSMASPSPLDDKATCSQAKGNRARTALTKAAEKEKEAEQRKRLTFSQAAV